MPDSIVDGFQYNLFLRNFPERYYPLALTQLEPFRRARGYRPRWYTVPDADNLGSIPAYGTIEEQLRIAPGSWLWGLSIALLAPAGPQTPCAIVDPTLVLMVQITDGATGLKLFSDFLSAGFIWTQGGGLPPAVIDNAPYILSQPRPVVEPGFVNVEIAEFTGVTLGRVQLVLYCMEPTVLIEEQLTTCQERPK